MFGRKGGKKQYKKLLVPLIWTWLFLLPCLVPSPSLHAAKKKAYEVREVGFWFVSGVGARVRVKVRGYFRVRGMWEATWDVGCNAFAIVVVVL